MFEKEFKYDIIMDTVNNRLSKFMREELVECTKCRALLRKEYAPKVEYVSFCSTNLYFCGRCKPEYDIMYDPIAGGTVYGYKEKTYFKNRVEVDKNGKVK